MRSRVAGRARVGRAIDFNGASNTDAAEGARALLHSHPPLSHTEGALRGAGMPPSRPGKPHNPLTEVSAVVGFVLKKSAID